MKIDFFRQIWT